MASESLRMHLGTSVILKIFWGGGGGGGMPPDPLEVVGPLGPPGAQVIKNSRYATDFLNIHSNVYRNDLLNIHQFNLLNVHQIDFLNVCATVH